MSRAGSQNLRDFFVNYVRNGAVGAGTHVREPIGHNAVRRTEAPVRALQHGNVVLRYGYELLISSVVSVLLVILVSAVCGDVRYSLSFLIGFIPQRIYIGGYHATSHTRCYLAFTGLALICILLSKVIAANHLFRILTTAALMGIAIFFSPIEATNKPLGKKKRLSYKMVASVLSSIDFLFAIFNVLPDTRSITVYYISKWVLVIFAIIPFFQKQAKIS